MKQSLQGYYDYTKAPWGQIYYKMIWQQLNEVKNVKILDFGSGFGTNASHFARENEVIAIEPDQEMIDHRFSEYPYTQIQGDIKDLSTFQDQSFDVILCHNVFEYALERKEILKEFHRLLKKDGFISLVKHNEAGRVMQKVVFENKVEEALEILDGKDGKSLSFGQISYYSNEDLLSWNQHFYIDSYKGIRVFYALQPNEVKYASDWQERLLTIENYVSDMDIYKNIAMFHHVIIKKKED